MKEIDIGDDSIIGFITPSGRELVVEQLEDGEESTLAEDEKYSSIRNFIMG